MTRLIKYSDLCVMGDFATYFTKQTFGGDDTLIAQSDKDEYWYQIHSYTNSELSTALKTGYTMYILTKYEK